MINLKDWLILHEGLRLKPYQCPSDKLTIGVGRNLEDTGISHDEAIFMLENDIRRCREELMPYSWFNTQDLNRQAALVNMCFNLGLTRLLKFKRMIAALEKRDYTQAAKEALDSLWAQQVGARAYDIASVIKDGR
jgi:lysozyme